MLLLAVVYTPANSTELECCGVEFFPKLKTSIIFTDNLFSLPSREKYAIINIINPGVHAQGGDDILQFVADADVEIGKVERSHDDDWEDIHLSAGMIYQPTTRAKFEAGVGVQYEHDARGDEYTAGAVGFSETPDEYTQRDYKGRFTYGAPGAKGQLIFSAEHNDKHYTNNREFTKWYDRKADHLGAIFKWQVMPKTKAVFEVRYNKFDYLNLFPAPTTITVDSEEKSYFVGVEWQATFKTSGRFQLGRLDKDFEASEREDIDDTVWEAGISWRPTSYSVVDFETGRSTNETTGSGSAIVRDTYEISWTHSWLNRLSTTLAYRYDDEDYSGSIREDTYEKLQLSANYKMRYWLQFEAGYSHAVRETKDFDILNDIFGFRENQVFIHAKIKF